MKIHKFGIATIAATLILVGSQPTNILNNSNNTSVYANGFDSQVEKTILTGKIKGIEDTTNQVLEWRGIPYAKAPVGENRWKAPQPAEKWNDTLDVTKAGTPAIQSSRGKLTGSEDALNLDVVRPKSNDNKLPVVVFIHGGNNQTGHAQELKGNTFVKDLNAVHVSVNYRLGPLGFNPLDAINTGNELENSGNYSLLDIERALTWVQENIETFGGDKNNITLVGFSAGGRDVMATLISPIFKGKYHKAISISGGMTLADKKESQEIFAEAIAPLVVEDKIKSTPEEAKQWLLTKQDDVREYLYKLSADRLAGLMGNAGIRMSVFPHLYKDGVVIPTDFSNATYNDVPLMLVTGKNEFSLFAAFDKYFAEDFTSGELFKNPSKLAEFEYVKRHGGELYRLANGVESARIMDGKYKSNIYIGEIAYGDDSAVTPELAKTFGSYHGVFEPFLQNPSNYAAQIKDAYNNDGAKDLGKHFKEYLRTFIQSGKPSSNNTTEWKPWSAANQEVLSLDADKSKSKISLISDKETAEDIVSIMTKDTSISQESKDKLHKTVLNGRWFSKELDKHTNGVN